MPISMIWRPDSMRTIGLPSASTSRPCWIARLTPLDFPAERSAGYVPESSLLAVEWYLPPVEVVPEQKAFRHVKTRKVVEPTARPLPEIRQIYQRVIAQIALRTLREVFDSAPTR